MVALPATGRAFLWRKTKVERTGTGGDGKKMGSFEAAFPENGEKTREKG